MTCVLVLGYHRCGLLRGGAGFSCVALCCFALSPEPCALSPRAMAPGRLSLAERQCDKLRTCDGGGREGEKKKRGGGLTHALTHPSHHIARVGQGKEIKREREGEK